MQTDFLIVGQGIAGSLLYYMLTKAGARCVVIDDNKSNSASRVAAGLINPVTGRRLVKTWMIDDLIPVFTRIYREIEKEFNISCLYETELTWHFPATDILEAYEKRLAARTDFLSLTNNDSQAYFNFPFNAGNINSCFIVDVQLLLDSVRSRVEQAGELFNDRFDHQQLRVSNASVQYKDVQARKIIFCEGSDAHNNPWFLPLPYSLNKGEALIVSIKDLPRKNIYKCWQTLVPLPGKDNLWWYGSNYIWNFDDDQPTKEFRSGAEMQLRSWLKLPISILEHKAAIRYATVERRPFVGFHPSSPNVGIFNGWGTKGCSLVPFFAEQMMNTLLDPSHPINTEADVSRFSRLLSAKAQ